MPNGKTCQTGKRENGKTGKRENGKTGKRENGKTKIQKILSISEGAEQSEMLI
jgi:hypothetical protein